MKSWKQIQDNIKVWQFYLVWSFYCLLIIYLTSCTPQPQGLAVEGERELVLDSV